jgi:hypothetical protein
MASAGSIIGPGARIAAPALGRVKYPRRPVLFSGAECCLLVWSILQHTEFLKRRTADGTAEKYSLHGSEGLQGAWESGGSGAT